MDNKTIQTYNHMAKEYDEGTIDFWEQFPRSFIDTFVKLAQGRVLNVGSGAGRDGLLLQERGLDVMCLDASEVMVQLCKERGLSSVLGDFSALPFEDTSFDGAWAYTSLLHVPKSEVSIAFREMRRVIKDGGILGLGLIEGETEEYRESSRIHLPRWFSLYTKDAVEKLLEDHGFKIVHFEYFQPRSKKYLNYIAQKQ